LLSVKRGTQAISKEDALRKEEKSAPSAASTKRNRDKRTRSRPKGEGRCVLKGYAPIRRGSDSVRELEKKRGRGRTLLQASSATGEEGKHS